MKEFLKRKNIEISLKRYGIDALGAMAQGLFCSLLIGTIIDTVGKQFGIPFLTQTVATLNAGGNTINYTVGGLASAMSGPAMAIAIGYALKCPPLALFSLAAVGFAANILGGAGGPLAVLFIAISAAEFGKAVSKETKVDILVTPLVTIAVGVFLSWLIAPLAICLFNNAHTIPVYHDARLRTTLRESMERLDEGNSILIFPEHNIPYNHILYDFQDRFIDLAKLYHRRTGKALAFVPLYIAPKLGEAHFGEPTRFNPDAPLDEERARIKRYLMDSITALAESLPEHTVIPYRNIRKRDYPKNKTEVSSHHETACC